MRYARSSDNAERSVFVLCNLDVELCLYLGRVVYFRLCHRGWLRNAFYEVTLLGGRLNIAGILCMAAIYGVASFSNLLIIAVAL